MSKYFTRAGASPAATRRFRIHATVEQVAIAAALFWTVAANRPFFAFALEGRAAADPSAIGLAAALMRNHKEARYLITPVSWMWSLGAVVAREAHGKAAARGAAGEPRQPLPHRGRPDGRAHGGLPRAARPDGGLPDRHADAAAGQPRVSNALRGREASRRRF
jgi:hypothetical protein